MDVHPPKYGTIGFDPWPVINWDAHRCIVTLAARSSKCIAKLEEKSSAKLRSSMDEFKAWGDEKMYGNTRGVYKIHFMIMFAYDTDVKEHAK